VHGNVGSGLEAYPWQLQKKSHPNTLPFSTAPNHDGRPDYWPMRMKH